MMANRAQDLDLPHLLRVLRRAALPVLLISVAVAVLTYVYASSRPPTYRATGSITALPSGSGNNVINTTLVTAPPLPPGVVARALRSPAVVDPAIARVRSAFPAPAVGLYLDELRRELRLGDFHLLTISADVNQEFVGAYEISALAPSPLLAKSIANSFVRSLLDWDRQRALVDISRARANLTTQRDDLTTRIAQGTDAINRRTLEQLRVDVVSRLQQVDILQQTVSGTLAALSAATDPLEPAQPQPRRDAILALAACVFFGTLTAFLLDQLRQRIRGLDDLRAFGQPVLGALPALTVRRNDPIQVGQAVRHGVYREQMEFVRVGLQSTLNLPGLPGVLPQARSPIIAVSSAQVGEGKSTIVAGLVYSLAAHGLKVLVVDADVFRRRQEQLWLAVHAGRPTQPQSRVLDSTRLYGEVSTNVDLLTLQHARMEPSQILPVVQELSGQYDLVVIDTPPVLKVADTLLLASQIDGLLLVTDAQAPHAQVARMLDETGRLGVRVLGFVLNRSTEVSRIGNYTYATPGSVRRVDTL